MKFSIFRILTVFPAMFFSAVAFLLVSNASAQADPNDPIIGISPFGGTCSTSGTNNLCNAGSPYSLSALESGNISFTVGTVNGAGSWVLVNNTGSTVNSLTLYYAGTLDSNHFLDLQVNGWSAATVPFVNCKITENNGTVTNGCSNNTGTPVSLPAQLNWSVTSPGGTTATGFGIAPGETFDLTIASFDTAHSDNGCISGTSTCTPTTTPEPASMLLFGTGLLALGGVLRRRFVFGVPNHI
jgi:hypothetical protein